MVYRSGPSPAGTCPRCRETLLDVDGVPAVKWCERCGGVFADAEASRRIMSTFDRTLLEVGFQAGLGKPRDASTRRPITCPECLVTMHVVRVESAACEVDACPAHGTWFDAGELEDVMRAFTSARRSVGLPPTRAPIAGTAPDSEGAKAAGTPGSILELVRALLS